MSRDIVVLSGGLDSTTALAVALKGCRELPVAIFFDYGQRHLDRELAAARDVAEHYGIELRVVPTRGIMSGSSLTDADKRVPREGYDEESMASTVVQGRNLLFAAVAIAASAEGGRVWLGVHGGDHHLYPDCRPEFWEGLTLLAQTAYATQIVTPFLHLSKSDIASRGADLDAPLHLTYSCYEGGEEHCGECGTCHERREAFSLAGIPDPTEYARGD